MPTTFRLPGSLRAVAVALTALVSLQALVGPADAASAPPPGSVATINADSPHYYRAGYCSDTGLGDAPSWAGDWPYWAAQCADNYLGGIDPAGHLVLGDLVGKGLRIRIWDLGARQRLSSRTLAIKGWTVQDLNVGSDGRYYVVLGRENSKQSDTYATLQVRAYDAALHPVGVADIDGGAAVMGIGSMGGLRVSSVLRNGILLVHMARYLYPQGFIAHQANLTFAVDTATMTPYRPEVTSGQAYVSHSFAQFAAGSGDDAVLVDHGDAYPRAIALTVLRGFFGSGPKASARRYVVTKLLPKKRSAIGQNFTGATVNGMAVGAGRALTVGASLPHTHPVKGISGVKHLSAPNAYVASTDLRTGRTQWRWLTKYSPRSHRTVVGEPRIAQIAKNRFVILYHVEKGHRPKSYADYSGKLRLVYRLVNAAGRVLATKSWKHRRFEPGSRLFVARKALWWVAGYQHGNDEHLRTRDLLFGIRVADPRHPRSLHR